MTLTTKFYSKIDDIENRHWESLGCGTNTYYTPEFLRAFEISNPDIDFNYILILQNEEAIAFANTQIVTIGIETITKNIKISNRFKGTINRFFQRNNIRVLFCGNVFLSGEYGTFLKAGFDKITLFDALADGVKELAKRTPKLHAIFVKDFYEESLYITDILKKCDYAPMKVEPNMIIYLDSEWQTFEDYKNALKSKYRIKANKADTTSTDLRAIEFDENNIAEHKQALQALYENTITNATFNAQILNLDTYMHLKSTYQDKFIVKGYFQNGQLVGFLSAMKNGKNLDAHFIGLDYSLNKQYAIYPRILNDYVRYGLANRCEKINLGRTASEIKSTLGAVPEELTCYIRHKRLFQNQFMKPFIRNIKIKTFKQHRPFKKNEKEAVLSS